MPKRLLIIEDDPAILEILNLIFSEQGYEVFLSATDEGSYRLPEIMPDLVLMDVRLNDSALDGDAICCRMKSQQATKHLPVILLSAETDLAALSLACGADGWIAKPFDVAVLTAKVHALLYPL